jgi:hypothetical protein
MHRIPGEEDGAIAVAFGHQQVMPSRDDMADFEVAGEPDQILDDRPEVGVRRQQGVQRELRRVPGATMLEPAGSAN